MASAEPARIRRWLVARGIVCLPKLAAEFKVVLAFDFAGGNEQAVGDVGGEQLRSAARHSGFHAGDVRAVVEHFHRR